MQVGGAGRAVEAFNGAGGHLLAPGGAAKRRPFSNRETDGALGPIDISANIT